MLPRASICREHSRQCWHPPCGLVSGDDRKLKDDPNYVGLKSVVNVEGVEGRANETGVISKCGQPDLRQSADDP